MRFWTGPRAASRTRADAHDDVAPLAWARSCTFGLVSGSIGVLGHDLVSHSPTHLPVLLAAIAFATLVARPLAPLRIDRRTMFLGLIAVQSVIHLACVAALDGTRFESGSMQMRMAMDVGELMLPQHGAGASVSSALAMVLVHLVVTALGVVVLLSLEAHAWEFVRDTVANFIGAPRVTARARRELQLRLLPRPVRAERTHFIGGTRPVRGPPASATTD